jgi:FeS assembly protein SufB
VKAAPKSLDELDPELLRTYEKLGIPLREQERLAGIAVDAVFDSVSVATTFRAKLAEAGVIFCSISEAIQKHPELVRKYLGSVVPYSDNFFATLNSAVFTDGSFAYIPKGVRCPMELSTYFRINAAQTGQFERTLIVADAGSYVSYLEGCTAPMRDENQLHAAVVELVALDDAEIKYSTVQNWYPGDENGKGGIYNFVTKRGACRGRNSKISWTQVETGSAITWKYPSCILQGDNSVGEFYSIAITNNMQQADTGTKMIHIGKNTPQHDHLQGHLGRPRQQHLSRPGARSAGAANARNYTQCDSLLIGDRCGAHTVPYIESAQPDGAGRARGDDLEDQRGPALLLPAARPLDRGRGVADRQRLLPRGAAGAADGIRGRGAEAGRPQPGGQRRLTAAPASIATDEHHARDQGPPRQRRRQADPRRPVAHHRRRRGARHHGPERLGQEHARLCAGRARRLRGDRRLSAFSRPGPARAAAGGAGRRGAVPRLPVPGRDPRRRHRDLPQGRLNAVRKHRGERELDAMEFLKLVRAKRKLLSIDDEMLKRPLNVGFSGGEKKRAEMLQMALLEPSLAVLDETDSGLDIDALKVVADGVNALRAPDRAILMITHYQRLLDYIVPDRVHVLAKGRIQRSGGKELALELEREGYGEIGPARGAA